MSGFPRVILLNGPAGSGKDTIADALQDRHENVIHAKLAAPLREYLNSIDNRFKSLEFFNAHKEDAIVQEGYQAEHVSARHVMIHYFQSKAAIHGDTWLAKEFIDNFDSFEYNAKTVFVLSDCGRQSEVDYVQGVLWPINLKLFRLHRIGYTFGSNDNRQYCKAVYEYDIKIREGRPQMGVQQVERYATNWLLQD